MELITHWPHPATDQKQTQRVKQHLSLLYSFSSPDINECTSLPEPCKPGFNCINTVGSYTCQRNTLSCSRGYHANEDGSRCVGEGSPGLGTGSPRGKIYFTAKDTPKCLWGMGICCPCSSGVGLCCRIVSLLHGVSLGALSSWFWLQMGFTGFHSRENVF